MQTKKTRKKQSGDKKQIEDTNFLSVEIDIFSLKFNDENTSRGVRKRI